MNDNVDVRQRVAVIQLEGEEVPSAQQQTMREDNIRRSLAPIISSMRTLGLYFSRQDPVNAETCTEKSRRSARRCHRWNFARIHATFMLVLAWVNAGRYATVFDGKETPGADLFIKLGTIPSGNARSWSLHKAGNDALRKRTEPISS